MKDLLPIGSVVTLKEGKKKLMIIGRIQENEKTKKLYDYAGCNWPEGYMDKDHCYVFNKKLEQESPDFSQERNALFVLYQLLGILVPDVLFYNLFAHISQSTHVVTVAP